MTPDTVHLTTLSLLLSLCAELSSQAIRSSMEKARHLAVSVVGPALKEFEAGVVRDGSWQYRPMEDALKVWISVIHSYFNVLYFGKQHGINYEDNLYRLVSGESSSKLFDCFTKPVTVAAKLIVFVAQKNDRDTV